MYYSYTKHTLFGLLIGVLAISILLYCLWSTITGGLGGYTQSHITTSICSGNKTVWLHSSGTFIYYAL